MPRLEEGEGLGAEEREAGCGDDGERESVV
jgi:hypothetical protein